MTTDAALYILLPSTLRTNLTMSRHERSHESISLVEPVTVSGVYRLAEPTSDGCTCADVVWGSSGTFTMTLHKVLRPLTDDELDSLEDAMDEADRAQLVKRLAEDFDE
jgi:hypothetical protein